MDVRDSTAEVHESLVDSSEQILRLMFASIPLKFVIGRLEFK